LAAGGVMGQTGETETVLLTEVGLDTAAFSGTLPISWNAADSASSSGTIYAVPGDTLKVIFIPGLVEAFVPIVALPPPVAVLLNTAAPVSAPVYVTQTETITVLSFTIGGDTTAQDTLVSLHVVFNGSPGIDSTYVESAKLYRDVVAFDRPIPEDLQQRFGARVLVADAGVRDVAEGDAEARAVGEAVGEVDLRAELDDAAQVLAVAAAVGADGEAGRQRPAAEEQIQVEAAVGVDRGIGGEQRPDQGPDAPTELGEACFDAALGGLVVAQHIEDPEAEHQRVAVVGGRGPRRARRQRQPRGHDQGEGKSHARLQTGRPGAGAV